MSGVRPARFLTSSLWTISLLYLAGFCLFLQSSIYDEDESLPSDADPFPSEPELADVDHDGIEGKVQVVGRNAPSYFFNSFDDIMAYRRTRFKEYQRRVPDTGPGELGKAVKLTEDEQKEADRLFPRETLNIVASDKVALDRKLKDFRDPE